MSRTPDPTVKIALLRAAEEVFADKGLVPAKVEEITRRAGTSKGAFYLHFASKEEAFKHVVESFLARVSSILPEPESLPVPDTTAGWLDTWLRIDGAMYEFLWANRAIVRILLGCQGDYVYLLEEFMAECHAQSVAWIREWQKHGMFRADLDAELAATLISGAHDRLVRTMVASNEKPPIAEWLRGAVAIFGRGFGSERLVAALDEIENPPVSHDIRSRRPQPSRRREARKASAR